MHHRLNLAMRSGRSECCVRVAAKSVRIFLALVGICLIASVASLHRTLQHPSTYSSVNDDADDVLPEASEDDMAMRKALLQYLTTPERTCRRLRPFGGTVSRGRVTGQKFVCLDEQYAPVAGDCLIYSVGVKSEWSFDREFVEFGCEVHAFDPSMRLYPERVNSQGVHFHRTGLDGFSGTDSRGWLMGTLSDLKQALGHGAGMLDYLKVSVDGAEWRWLRGDTAGLDTVRQLGIRVHLNTTPDGLRRHYDTLRRIRDTGLRLVHSYPARELGEQRVIPVSNGNLSSAYDLLWVKM